MAGSQAAREAGRRAGQIKLSRARSRLYQRRFLRTNTHFSAFFKIYKNSYAQFQIFSIFRNVCLIFFEIQHLLQIFTGESRFARFSRIFREFFGISQSFYDFDESDVAITIFHRFLRKMQKLEKYKKSIYFFLFSHFSKFSIFPHKSNHDLHGRGSVGAQPPENNPENLLGWSSLNYPIILRASGVCTDAFATSSDALSSSSTL